MYSVLPPPNLSTAQSKEVKFYSLMVRYFNDDGIHVWNTGGKTICHRGFRSYLEIEAVRVSLEVISTGLHEKSVLHLTLHALKNKRTLLCKCLIKQKYCTIHCKKRLATRGGQNDDFGPLTYTLGGGGGVQLHGVQEQICDILTQDSYESLPALLATQIPTLWIHTWGGGSDIRAMSSIRPICKCRCPPLLATFPSPARMSLTRTKVSLQTGKIKLFPPRESLVSDIPAEDGNVTHFFYGVCIKNVSYIDF
jgi:hypothetical protein